MNADLEERLIESMHQRVDGIALSGDVLARATSRHQRRTTMTRVGYGLGVAGLAGVLAAGLTGGTGGAPSRPAAQPPAVQIVPAAMKLEKAAKASDKVSYRLRLKTSVGEPYGQTTEGAFDPKTSTGYLRTPHEDSVQTELLIDGTRYAGGEPLPGGPPPDWHGETFSRYGRYPGKHKSFLYWSTDAVLVKAGPDPGSLVKALKEVDATTSENPDGTLHFEYGTSSKDGWRKSAGDVTLNGDGRIAKITLSTDSRYTAKGKTHTGKFTDTLELFDYGLEVKVKVPTDVVPSN
jgi:hypothetical protein